MPPPAAIADVDVEQRRHRLGARGIEAALRKCARRDVPAAIEQERADPGEIASGDGHSALPAGRPGMPSTLARIRDQ
jgi:hypothetical protein